MKVYLDDHRTAPSGWFRTYNAEQTIKLLEAGAVEELSLDHDITEEHYDGDYSDRQTGYDVLLWLCEKASKREVRVPGIIKIHSWNSIGRERMEQALRALRRIEHELEL